MTQTPSLFKWTHPSGVTITADFLSMAAIQKDSAYILEEMFSEILRYYKLDNLDKAESLLMHALDIATDGPEAFAFFKQKFAEAGRESFVFECLLRRAKWAAAKGQIEKVETFLSMAFGENPEGLENVRDELEQALDLLKT